MSQQTTRVYDHSKQSYQFQKQQVKRPNKGILYIFQYKQDKIEPSDHTSWKTC